MTPEDLDKVCEYYEERIKKNSTGFEVKIISVLSKYDSKYETQVGELRSELVNNIRAIMKDKKINEVIYFQKIDFKNRVPEDDDIIDNSMGYQLFFNRQNKSIIYINNSVIPKELLDRETTNKEEIFLSKTMQYLHNSHELQKEETPIFAIVLLIPINDKKKDFPPKEQIISAANDNEFVKFSQAA